MGNPLDIPGCVLWLRADLGVTYVQGPVTATGTTPPAVTLTGQPVSPSTSLEIDITLGGLRGTAVFSWKLNGVVQQTLQLTAATFALGTTGVTANFAAGTYTNDNVYTSVVVVSTWADQSSLANAAVQATASNRPSYNAVDSSYNGSPSLSFAKAASQSMATGSIATYAQPYTIIFVANDDAGGAYVVVSGTTSVSGIYTNSGPISIYAGSAHGSATSMSNPTVVAGIFNGANSTLYANSSSVPILTTSPGSGALDGTVAIGNSGLAGPMNGKIAEVVVYSNALTTSQLRSLFMYLGSRYAITVS